MNEWLKTLSRGALASLVIGGGIVFIILSDPPHTVCDSQIELFRNEQKGLLFTEKLGKIKQTTKIEVLTNHCKKTNSPGGCYELFGLLKRLLSSLDHVPKQCRSVVGEISQVKKAMINSTELIVQLAWGEKPPDSVTEKYGWLDSADISLFCRLKNTTKEIYGESNWTDLREKLLGELPGAENLNRKESWSRILLSVNCEQVF